MDVDIENAAEMKRFGERLGRLLRGGEVLELVGDVGSGKTTLTKGIAVGLGVDEDVQSPSFTISRVYDAKGGIQMSHYDFYRLNDAGIMADALDESVGDAKAVTVIEWGGIVRGVLPEDRLTIEITAPAETRRQLSIHAAGARSQTLIKGLKV